MESVEIENNSSPFKVLRGVFRRFAEDVDYTGDEDYINLSELDTSKITELLKELENSGRFVFHGNPSKEILSELEPRPAQDNFTTENSMDAVFATPRHLEALAYGVIDKFSVSLVWKGFTVQLGYEASKGVYIKTDPEVYNLITSNPSEYLQDTLLYVLDKNSFKTVPGREDSEYYSQEAINPVATLYVPKEVILQSVSFESFSEEEVGKASSPERR